MLRPDALRIKTHFSSSAAAAAGSLANNDDLLVEILVRLPIPSVLRFKSVSKRWLSLISDPNFSHRRITFYPPTPSGIFLTRHFWRPVPRGFGFVVLRPNPPQVPFESLEPSVPKRRIEILQSCNGLLLCCSYGRRYGKNTYYVYNPMTKQYTTLPMMILAPGGPGAKVAFPFSFNLEKKPRASRGWGTNIKEYFGNCCGHLYWIEGVDRHMELIVFEMEDERCGWFVKYRVDLQRVSSSFPDPGYVEVPAWEPKFRVIAIVDQSEVGEEPYVV